MTRQALPPYSFPQGWQNPARKGITAYKGKEEQLKEMSLFCQALGAEVQYHPLHRYFTAMFWDGWDLAYNEGPALAIQQKIQRRTAQYPDLVCYCFDPFSTLIYAI